MALSNSLNKFRSEFSEATARNAQHARPSSTTAMGRSGTPRPAGESSRRPNENTFAGASSSSGGAELFTQVHGAVKYLREKDGKPVSFDNLIDYLSLPNDAQRNIPTIKTLLIGHNQVDFIPKSESESGKDMFKYRPTHPVRNSEELKNYLAAQPTAQGIVVKDLKDGWPECVPAIDRLEKEGFCLVTRNKKDDTPKTVWGDSPTYHILNPNSQLPQKLDADFVETWSKTRLPASEVEIRNELEKAGLVPTSQVKEIKRSEVKRKEKRRVNRKGGKTTNSHMLGILKDYSKK